jgi:hypothetical protein
VRSRRRPRQRAHERAEARPEDDVRKADRDDREHTDERSRRERVVTKTEWNRQQIDEERRVARADAGRQPDGRPGAVEQPLRAVDRRRFVDLELDQVERVQAEECRQRKHPDDSGCAEKICSRPHPGGTLGA